MLPTSHVWIWMTESIEKFAGQIDPVLGYIEKLNQVDTRGHKTNFACHLSDQCLSRR